jgi:hypothetical protein
MLRSIFRTRVSLQIEILALRYQLAVLQRQKKRASLRVTDRLVWVIISRFLEALTFGAGHSQTGNSNWLALKTSSPHHHYAE